MSRNPLTEPRRLSQGWQAIAVGAAVLVLVELARGKVSVGASVFGFSGVLGSVLAIVLGMLVVVALHHGLVWTLVVLGARRFDQRVVFWATLGLCVLYGSLWQATVTGGDGIRASRYALVIRAGLGTAIPLGLAGLAAFVFWPGRLQARTRTLVLAALLGASVLVTLFVLPTYRPFHGFLGGFEATVAALLVAGRRATRPLSFAMLVLGVIAIPLLAPRAFAAQGYARRFTVMPGTMLDALPLSRALLPDVALFVDPQMRPPGVERPVPVAAPPAAARGDSVLLVVLEATRADVWSDPNVAPEFARWRSHGLTVMQAVAQYPATPLAYGALFTSHPPSVVAQSPHWNKHHLFDLLAPRFRHVFLSQPSAAWFSTGAITSFITGNPTRVRRHKTTWQAMSDLKAFLTDEASRGPFFAWAHLFDPHRPYTARGGVSPQAPPAERYRSEVKALDADLGAFMRWFYEQPFAARTLVVVIGDHGQALGEILDGEPYFGHHVHVAGVVTRIPFYASGAGLPEGAVNAEVRMSQLDVMPTIFDFLGVELPARFAVQGMPLPKVLAERPLRSLPTEAFSIRGSEFFAFVKRAGRSDARAQRQFFREMWQTGTYAPKLALERGRWKIVRDAVLGDDVLYDLERDPHETTNLAAERTAELTAMRQALEDWSLDQVSALKRLDRLQ
jgi:arylsulfatase A-like enzyme